MQRLDFNTGWHFSCPDGRDFDVTLPHDAMLNTTRNTEPGFTWFLLAGWRGNDYTYTKNLHITSELINKHLVLEFEGVYCMTTVTVNDRPAAEKAYGYTPFTVELDGLLREGDNTIEVTAHVPQDGHNRWYTGGGIYRPVHLLVGEDAYMERYGVRITTLSVAPACVRVEVMTHGGDCAEVRIAEKNGKEVVCAKAAVADGHAVVELEIPNAKLWNAEHPNLYLAEVTLYSGGKAVDTVTESFGLRVIEIDPARGLLINGEPTFLRGGCIHNDMGVIGVINNDATELHRARNIKKAGFNAIRSAHHPMSRSLMKACDEVGLYVMDEAFDYWYRMKSPNSPYNRYFMQDFKVDTAAMVQDAYNHPSVVIYSIGNEIPEAGGVKGVRVGKEIVDAMGHDYSALALHRGAAGNELVLYRGKVTARTAEGVAEEEAVLRLPFAGDTATLRLYFEDGGTVHYACEVNGQETPLDGSFPAAKSTWSGAKPALFARNTANRAGGQGRFGAVSFECL